MDIRFSSEDHRAFFDKQRERAKLEGIPLDSYFNSLCYLCGLCEETRSHFQNIFDWQERGIHITALAYGWQTGTSLKVTRLAFNLWNGCGMESEESETISASYLPDELFCCELQKYFFEAIRLRFPEYHIAKFGKSQLNFFQENRHQTTIYSGGVYFFGYSLLILLAPVM